MSTLAHRVKPARPTLAEQETILRWDREAPEVSLFSASPVVWRKLARLGLEPVRRSTTLGEETGRFYRVPVGRLRWSVARERPAGQPKPGGNLVALARARAQRRDQGRDQGSGADLLPGHTGT